MSNTNYEYWRLIHTGPTDDPLENISRALFLLNNYDGDPEYLDQRFADKMDALLNEIYGQVKAITESEPERH